MLLGTYNPDAHRGIARFAAENGWHLHADTARIPIVPFGWTGDGIVAGLGEWDEPVRFIQDPSVAAIPKVDIYQIRTEVKLPRVVGDHLMVGRQAADYYLNGRWRHFAWFSRVPHNVAKLRLQGFSETVKNAGFSTTILAAEISKAGLGAPWERTRTALIRDLEKAEYPLAVLAFNDFDAALVEDACHCIGLAVPDQVAIMGVDNNDLVVNCLPVPLSSVRLDLDRIGYEGAALLQKLMMGAKAPAAPLLIPPRGVAARASTDTTPTHHPLVQKAIEYMQEHLAETVTVDQVALVCETSRRSLEMLFQKDLQRTPHTQLVLLRFKKAKELLEKTDYPIHEVASLCGFSSGPHLHREFKNHFKTTPRAWRKQ